MSKLSNLSLNLSKQDFFILHFNVRSLPKNINKLDEFLNDFQRMPDAIAISETKLNSNNVSKIKIPNYNFLRSDSSTNVGGVGLYIKDIIKFSLRNDLKLNLQDCEDLWLEVDCNKSNLIVAVVYRHPKQDISPFHDKLCRNLNELENNKEKYILSGDINIDTLSVQTTGASKVKNYVDDLISSGCKLLINIPTRFADNCKSSLLDHIYTNFTNKNNQSGVCIFEISDHLPIFFIAKNVKCFSNKRTKFIRSLKNFNSENFVIDLQNKLSTIGAEVETNVNQEVANLTTMFNSVLDKHAPKRLMSRKEKRLSDKPWITRGILKSIKTKNKLFKKYFKSKQGISNDKKVLYKKYLNKLTHVKNLAKRNYYESIIKNNNKNPSQIWSVINEIVDYKNSASKDKFPSAITIENETVKTDSQKFLDKLCKYFANIGANMSKNLQHTNTSSFKIHHKTCMKSFILQDIFKEEVSDAIASIKSSSAPGIDEITPKFVKIAKGILSPILAKLFTKCIHQETFPSDFKVAYVIPIPKTSSPKSLDEFRPISLLSVFSKLFEKILKIKMLKFISKNNILTPFQYGFRENNSTELAITAFYDKLLKNLNENKITCSIFLDLRKAFDSVNHSILLKKLYHYGFRGKIYELLNSYLAD